MIRRLLRSEFFELSVLFALLVVALIAAIVIDRKDRRERDTCADTGGVVEKYNQRTVYISVSCGSGCMMTVPQETYDWRCVKR